MPDNNSLLPRTDVFSHKLYGAVKEVTYVAAKSAQRHETHQVVMKTTKYNFHYEMS